MHACDVAAGRDLVEFSADSETRPAVGDRPGAIRGIHERVCKDRGLVDESLEDGDASARYAGMPGSMGGMVGGALREGLGQEIGTVISGEDFGDGRRVQHIGVYGIAGGIRHDVVHGPAEGLGPQRVGAWVGFFP